MIPLAIISGCGSSRKTTTTPARRPPVTQQLPQPPEKPEANVHISVAYPTSGEYKPKVDSNFILGSVGNGNATLTINGFDIPVSKNGAFLAFLPMPLDGVYHLDAELNTNRDSATVSFRPAPFVTGKTGTTSGAKSIEPLHKWATVTKGSDTLQTGSDVVPGAPSPDADRKWFFPRGARLLIIGKEGNDYKVELDKNVTAWVADTNVSFGAPEAGPIGAESLTTEPGFFDFTVPSNFSPFLIEASGSVLTLNVYGTLSRSRNTTLSDPMIASMGTEASREWNVYTFNLKNPVWGYKAFYTNDGSIVVRVRRPPSVDRSEPVKGIYIMLDPGHPPGGAIGPTGLTEAEANLAIATRVRDQLSAKGAIVLMTHSNLSGLVSSTNQIQELDARTAYAVSQNVDIMVSIHNNAFPDGANPFNSYGTSTYYYNPFSAALAGALDREIVQVTGIPNLNANHKSLAVCRPTWMPCALTESLYMMFPDQEQALRDPGFLDKLAAAHVRGIEDFLRSKTP